MDKETKAAVMKILDNIEERQKKLNKISDSREAATKQFDKESSVLHIELDKLHEQKRVLMHRAVEEMVGY